MAIYKIKVSKDEINFEWAVIDTWFSPVKVIRNPTEDDLRNAIEKTYNSTNICSVCREENNITDDSILYPRNACHNINKKGKKTEEYVCMKHYNRNHQRYDPNSSLNVIKSVADRRTGNLNDCRHILADKYEELTKEWTGAERLATKYNKYARLSLDHGPITKHVLVTIDGKLVDLYEMIPQTKGKRYDPKNRYWYESISNERGKDFDMLIFYCASEDGKTIERIYIFPKEAIKDKGSITIYKIYTKVINRWHERYQVKDEDILRKVNELYKC